MLTFRDVNDAVCDCKYGDEVDDEGWRFCGYSHRRCHDVIMNSQCRTLRDLFSNEIDKQEAIEMEEERRGYK